MAVSRLLAAATEGDPGDIRATIVGEACELFRANRAELLVQEAGRRARDADAHAHDVDAHPVLAELIDRRLRLARVGADRIGELGALADGEAALLLLLREQNRLDSVLVISGLEGRPIEAADAEVATAFADAAAAALDRGRALAEHERQARQQRALTRAAKSLNESLDLDTVLARICTEAVEVTDADIAGVYRGTEDATLVLSHVQGLPPETIGWELPSGTGLAGKIVQQRRAMLTNDYERIAGLPASSPLPAIKCAMGAPMAWDDALRGVLTVGFLDARAISQADLALLETFAELAASACANASAHAGLAHVARTDGLTGCLNHAALHDGLAKEIERALRGGLPPLSLILIDLDEFKQVNEEQGHLAGDEVLRRAGEALRSGLRPYDLAARYGGDEFALVAVDADEATASEMAVRVLARLGSPATAGVAQWSAGVSAVDLVARADRALLFAKQEGWRGGVHPFSAVPDSFGPARHRGQTLLSRVGPEPPPLEWPEARVDERLRKRTRQLALANELGARLSAMTRPFDILDAAVDELHRAFGFFHASAIALRGNRVEAVALRGLGVAGWSQRVSAGLIGRCLRERRPVLVNDVQADPDYVSTEATAAARSEVVVPLWVGDELYGVIDIEAVDPGAFDQDDVTLLETVATQVGSALRGAELYERLERAYLGTAAALAAALEAKDAYTADHAASIAAQAEAVGRRLELSEDALRDLRFAAVFHDIGKIAVPESILHKPGPLSPEQRTVMERHTVVGEQILAPVEFLSEVRVLVRHEHERWDGAGYPDGLAGEAIPLGSRIVLVCDALHAMTSDRPYRKAMSLERALEELRAHAGTQFDPTVVEALLTELDAEDA